MVRPVRVLNPNPILRKQPLKGAGTTQSRSGDEHNESMRIQESIFPKIIFGSTQDTGLLFEYRLYLLLGH